MCQHCVSVSSPWWHPDGTLCGSPFHQHMNGWMWHIVLKHFKLLLSCCCQHHILLLWAITSRALTLVSWDSGWLDWRWTCSVISAWRTCPMTCASVTATMNWNCWGSSLSFISTTRQSAYLSLTKLLQNNIIVHFLCHKFKGPEYLASHQINQKTHLNLPVFLLTTILNLKCENLCENVSVRGSQTQIHVVD